MITIAFLAEWALRSSVLILGGVLVLAAVRVKDPAIRLAAWTAMLCGSLAVPALHATLPRVPLRVTNTVARQAEIPTPMSNRVRRGDRTVLKTAPAFDWRLAAIALYLTVAGSLLLRLLIGLGMSWRLVFTSRATGEATEGIEIRESDRVASPVALGIAPALIMLPNDWREWAVAKLDAVLAHERSHIRRHDLEVQFLSNVHRALLWFSPLSWLVHLRIVRLAEEASDDAAVAVIGDRTSYAEVLMDFMQRGTRGVTWQGVPMARYAKPEERIHRILDTTVLSRGVTRWGLLTILALGAPIAYVAAAARPQSPAQPATVNPTVTEAQKLLKQGEVDEANALLDERLKANPDDAELLVMKAGALVRKGECDEARAVLQKVLRENPRDSDALLELGVAGLMQKRFEEAQDAFRKAYSIDPSNVRGLVGVAETYFQQDEPEQAVQVIQEAAQAQPQRTELKEEKARAELRAKQFDQAIADFEAIVDRYADSPVEQAEIYRNIGSAYAAQGDYRNAIESMRRATRLDPKNVGHLAALAQFYDMAGQRPDAMEAYRQALKLDPNNAVVMNNLAYLIAGAGGNLDEALSLTQRAKEQMPNMNEIRDTIGWIYIKRHQTESAVEEFRDLVDRVPDNSTFHYHYAMALAQRGDKAGALRELKTALQFHPRENEEKEIKEMIGSL